MSRSQHVTQRMAMMSIQQGDLDVAFAHGLKRNVKRCYRIEKKVYALAQVGRAASTLRNSVVYHAISQIMKRRHRPG